MICQMATFGEWLTEELKRQKIRSGELADRAGIDPGAISRSGTDSRQSAHVR